MSLITLKCKECNKKREKKRSIISRIILIIFILIIIVLNVPIPIHNNLSTIEIKMNDPNYIKKRNISISGYYHINVLTDNKFTGEISIRQYPKTYNNSKMHYLEFSRDSDGHAPVYYELNNGDEYLFGSLYSEWLLSDVIILVFEPNAGFASDSGRCIVSNVTSFDDALRKIQKSGMFQ